MDKKKILIVDDNNINRTILYSILSDEYDLCEAENGSIALKTIEEKQDELDLILLDLVMPEIDGLQVLKTMKENDWISKIPVIMISSETVSSFIREAYDLGAIDYIGRPFDSEIIRKRIDNTIKLYAKQKSLVNEVNLQVSNRLKENKILINILSNIVEIRNGESGAHIIHINKITEILFNELFKITNEYDEYKDDLPMICTASALHDIGKMSIPDHILNKPGKLTFGEFEIMKTHTTLGSEMVENVEDEYNDEKIVFYAKNICLCHHEKYDGKGYPKGLKGDDIPIYAQVISIADCYDALVSVRCYKDAYSHEKAIEMIKNGECGAFNSKLLECLDKAADDIKKLY